MGLLTSFFKNGETRPSLRPDPVALEKSPKKVLQTWQKSAQIVLDFCKRSKSRTNQNRLFPRLKGP